MPHQTCTICLLPNREEVDNALLLLDSVRRVASRWNLSRSSVARHRSRGHFLVSKPGSLTDGTNTPDQAPDRAAETHAIAQDGPTIFPGALKGKRRVKGVSVKQALAIGHLMTGLSMQRVAALIGVHESTVRGWCRDSEPVKQQLERLEREHWATVQRRADLHPPPGAVAVGVEREAATAGGLPARGMRAASYPLAAIFHPPGPA